MNERREEMLSDEEFYEKYLAGKEWPPESEEDRRLTDRIRQEIQDSADKEEAMLKEHPELDGKEPDPDMLEKILEKGRKKSYHPEEYLTDEDRKALEIGRKKLHRTKNRGWYRHWTAMVAALACVFIVGVSTDANRVKLVNVLSTWIGDEALVKVNNETNREDYESTERLADIEIEEKLGIKPIHFLYELKGMEFDRYEIDESAQIAKLFYIYEDSILTIIMRQNDDGTAKGTMKDGTITETFNVKTDIGEIAVLSIDGRLGKKYMAEFIYGNAYYHIFGEMPKKEFVNLISSIFF